MEQGKTAETIKRKHIMKVIDDYINGNLTAAKEGAKRQAWRNLFRTLMDEYGHTSESATAVADYLKGQGTFQAACDAEHKAKQSGDFGQQSRYQIH